jgi:hypothetical protein
MIYLALPLMIAWNQFVASASLLPIALTSQAFISTLAHGPRLHPRAGFSAKHETYGRLHASARVPAIVV